jgi:hypothetical protein
LSTACCSAFGSISLPTFDPQGLVLCRALPGIEAVTDGVVEEQFGPGIAEDGHGVRGWLSKHRHRHRGEQPGMARPACDTDAPYAQITLVVSETN